MSDAAVSEIRRALMDIVDPEAGENIVALGLIYAVETLPDRSVRVTMTTTAPGCPAADFLTEAVRRRVLDSGMATTVEVLLTYEPRWSPAMIRA